MGDDQHRHAFICQQPDGVEHLRHEFRIERGGHLVEQQDLRLQRQGTGDGHPLLLPARQFVGIAVELVGEADLGQQGAGGRLDLVLRTPLDLDGGNCDVLQRRHVLEQVVLLEHDGEPITQPPHRARVRIVDLLSVDRHRPRGWRRQADQRSQDRALARARRPDQPDDVARRDIEVDAVQNLQGSVAGLKAGDGETGQGGSPGMRRGVRAARTRENRRPGSSRTPERLKSPCC